MTTSEFIQEITLHPISTSRVIRVSHSTLDAFVDPSTEETSDAPRKPLPLAAVLSNLEALHARCNGEHVCGLSRRAQRFDLADYLALSRAYREGC